MNCGKGREGLEPRCTKCGGLFDLKPDFTYKDSFADNFPYIESWLELGEITTPLVDRGNFSFKLDYYSPTFSYKDRGARSLISYLKSVADRYGVHKINEDSSGNAGASIAAYGKAAGFIVNIFVPEVTSPAKVAQIESYGANIVKVRGLRADVQVAAEEAKGVFASHVLMPEFRDGIRSLAYELFNQLGGKAPEHVFVPVSAGTLLLGVHSGFRHLVDSGEIDSMPEIVAVQTEIVSPLCARISGRDFDPNRKVDSVADALVSMKPALIEPMVQALESGRCVTVTEGEIREARRNLAMAGIYVEYSSATVYAAYKKKNYEGKSVMVLTGNGLKNPPP